MTGLLPIALISNKVIKKKLGENKANPNQSWTTKITHIFEGMVSGYYKIIKVSYIQFGQFGQLNSMKFKYPHYHIPETVMAVK